VLSRTQQSAARLDLQHGQRLLALCPNRGDGSGDSPGRDTHQGRRAVRLLHPMIAIVAMTTSSLSVIGNSVA
jgi:hypothetical protein